VEDVITLYPCSSGGESKDQSVTWRKKGGDILKSPRRMTGADGSSQ